LGAAAGAGPPEQPPNRKNAPVVGFESGITNFAMTPDGPPSGRAQSSASAPLDRRPSQIVSPMDRPRRVTRLSAATEGPPSLGNEEMGWGDDAERQSIPKLTTPYPSLNAFPRPSVPSSSPSQTPLTGVSSTSRTSSYQTLDTQPTGISQSP